MPSLMVGSSVCKFADFQSDWFARWYAYAYGGPTAPIVQPLELERYHRKDWEYSIVLQALLERGMIGPGRRGLGFAVGSEPLAAILASYGTTIVATDAPSDSPNSADWKRSNEYAQSLDSIYKEHILDRDTFNRLVTFQSLDMNADMPFAAQSFDFMWSCCALEHLGTLNHGASFMLRAAQLLKPGGVAVHTTEYNVSSNLETIVSGINVIYRRQDIEEISQLLRHQGKYIEKLDFDAGTHPYDLDYDREPYCGKPGRHHVKLQIENHVATSMLLIIRA